jgi:hypothetical protein
MQVMRPIDDYDVTAWAAYYAAHPNMARSVGAAGEEGGAEGADAGDGAEGANAGGEGAEAGADSAGGAAAAEAQAAVAADANGGDAAGGEGGDDWRAAIADEKLRDHAGRFASVQDLVKAHQDLRKQLSGAIVPPGKDATDEQVKAYREKMGIPETPDAYEFDLPEGAEQTEADKAFEGEMRKALHEAGVPASAAKAVGTAFMGYIQQQQEAQTAQDTEYQQQAEAALRKTWGKDYDANVQYAGEADNRMFDGQLGQLELKSGQLLGSHPDFLKGMAPVGRMFGEGEIHIAPSAADAQTMRDQADQARQKRQDALAKGDQKSARHWDEEERKILAKMDGNKPLVGAEGRQY